MDFLEITEQEFDEFALRHDLANFWQTSDMADLRGLKGWKKDYVGVKEDGVVIAATMLSHMPVFMGNELYQALRGYLIDFHNKELLTFFHEHLIEYLKAHKCLYLRIDPYVPYRERNLDGSLKEDGFNNQSIIDHLISLGYEHRGFTTGYFSDCEPRWIYVINLENETEDSLLSKMERKAKRSVLKTEKYKIKTRFLEDDISEFEKVMEHTSQRRGFENRDNDYYENLKKIFGAKNHIKFLVAELFVDDYIISLKEDEAVELKKIEVCEKKLKDNPGSPKITKQKTQAEELLAGVHKRLEEADQMKQSKGDVIKVAAGLFFTYGNEILCLYSGVYDEYMKFASPYAMHWFMMRYGLEQGKKRYNLYGITGDFRPEAVDYGVYEFKKGFSGEVVELIGDFDYIVNKPAYAMYTKLRGIKHKIKK